MYRLYVPQLLLAERKLNEAAPLLQQGGPLVDAWQGNTQQKEYLKVGAPPARGIGEAAEIPQSRDPDGETGSWK